MLRKADKKHRTPKAFIKSVPCAFYAELHVFLLQQRNVVILCSWLLSRSLHPFATGSLEYFDFDCVVDV